MKNKPECPLCAVKMRYSFSKFGYRFFKCRQCGHGFFYPRPGKTDIMSRYSDEYFKNEYLDSYGASWDSFNMEIIRNRFDYIENEFLKKYDFSKKEKKILDIGCGGGFLLKNFQEKGWQTLGMDIIDASVTYSREQLGVNAVKADIERIDPACITDKYGFFDLVTMTDALEHVFDPAGVVQKIRRMLKPRGLVFISVPNIKSISFKCLGKEWAIISPLEHISYFSQKSLKMVMDQSGFCNLNSYTLQYVNSANIHRRGIRYFLGRTGLYILTRIFHLAFEKKECYHEILGQGYFRSAGNHGIQGDVLLITGEKS